MSRKQQKELFIDYEAVVITFPLYIKSVSKLTGSFNMGTYQEFYTYDSITYCKYYEDKRYENIVFNEDKKGLKVGLNFGRIENEDYESWLKIYKTRCEDITEEEYKAAFKRIIEEHDKFSGNTSEGPHETGESMSYESTTTEPDTPF